MVNEDSLLGASNTWDFGNNKIKPPKPPGPVMRYGVIRPLYAAPIE
jgi:hypothetical protein